MVPETQDEVDLGLVSTVTEHDEAGRAGASPLVVLEHITKRFPGVVANDDVSIDLRPGEVHALIGENGAGKSTLMRVLYGMYPADGAVIVIRGEERRSRLLATRSRSASAWSTSTSCWWIRSPSPRT